MKDYPLDKIILHGNTTILEGNRDITTNGNVRWHEVSDHLPH